MLEQSALSNGMHAEVHHVPARRFCTQMHSGSLLDVTGMRIDQCDPAAEIVRCDEAVEVRTTAGE